jgi:hypothetical protein
MPVAVLKVGHKLIPNFAYPSTGRVRIYMEATHPVDVFVSSQEQAPQINSVQTAQQLQILNFPQRIGMNEVVPLSPTWRNGWTLTIGHPGTHNEVIGVYYFVSEA